MVQKPENERILDFSPGSEEREMVQKEMDEILRNYREISVVVGGRRIKTDDTRECTLPHDKNKSIGKYHKATKEIADLAVEKAMEAREKWAEMPREHRLSVFIKAAELLSKKYRYRADAIVMLVHSKNPFQAEIDVAELIDFLRFNAYYAERITGEQPDSAPGTYNRMDYRPLEGFVFAIPPFNFLSIDGNLPTAPAIMGNVVIWKPPSSVVYSNYFIMEVLEEAGIPDGVINFVPGDSLKIGDYLLTNRNLAGVHFTGSTITLQHIFRVIGENIQK